MSMKNTKIEYPVESRYSAAGLFNVASSTETDFATGTRHRVFYPEPATGAYPLLVWGNGTGSTSDDYEQLLRHIASWGIIAAGNYCKESGTGAELVETAEYLLSLSDNPDSRFRWMIDGNRLAAAGCSQGSTGAIKSHTDFTFGKRMKTVVAIALPALHWCDPEDKYDTSLMAAPLLILGGRRDFIISPKRSNRKAVEHTPGDLPAFYAAAAAGHLEIQGSGGKLKGYLTAWLRYWLCNDEFASQAFCGESPEIMNNKKWDALIKRKKDGGEIEGNSYRQCRRKG